MNLIERYIFKRAGTAALMTLGSLAGVVWIIQALRELDVFTTKGQTILAYLALTTLAIPMLLLAVIPIALLLATIFAVNTMNANSELVVVNASGASNWVLVKPLIVLALLCSLFTGLVGHFVSPWSLLSLKVFTTQMRADLVSVLVREGQFSKIEDGLIFHVARREAGGVLSGIVISDEREPDKSVIFTASKGYVQRQDDGAFLLLRDGEIQQRATDTGNLTVIKYDSYVFDLSTFTRKIKLGNLRPKERTTPELLNPDPNDPYYKERPGLYRSQIHERFSEMLWPFAYVMVMLAFIGQARSSRQNYGSAIGAGMLIVTALRGTAFSAVSAIKGDEAIVWLVYALPLVGIAGGTWFLATNRPVALPKAMQERIDRAGASFRRAVNELVGKYFDWRRRLIGARA
ncbi:MAG: LPS export ABC transporter permease LptF [Nitratireductor sp.]|nr:LPS export ABC transporter permease LptF [Nitratireductor sp.]